MYCKQVYYYIPIKCVVKAAYFKWKITSNKFNSDYYITSNNVIVILLFISIILLCNLSGNNNLIAFVSIVSNSSWVYRGIFLLLKTIQNRKSAAVAILSMLWHNV